MNPISRKTFSIEDIKSLFPEATPAEVLALLKEEREREEREREEREREREREEREREREREERERKREREEREREREREEREREREREEREREEREREREREERDRNEKRKTIEELLLWTDDLSARMAIHELATHMPLDLIISGLRTYPSTEWGLLPG